VRRDGRLLTSWVYPNNDHWRNVSSVALHEYFKNKTHSNIYTNDSGLIKLEFDDALSTLFICSPSDPEATQIPYEVVSFGLNKWLVKQPRL
jgi:hypothetical protein